jgi:beta-glucosidase/6-phospho-beta-glucosidase/beta-galactosidase
MTPASPLELDSGFVVATGLECSAPLIEGNLRQDELRKTGHWERYAEDFALISGLGVRYVRYGIPFHVVAARPGRSDWDWTDRALEALLGAGLEPIADLLHFGVPDHLSGMGDPRLAERFEEYADAFAQRYPWIRYYTVVNEPLVCAVGSAAVGWWNERRRDDESLVAAVDGLCASAILGSERIRSRRPDAIFIQSDACEVYVPATPEAAPRVAFLNERRFVAFDLVYGRTPSPSVVDWLGRHGMTDERLDWFARRGGAEGCIVGLDYYRGNEWSVTADGGARPSRRRLGFARLARQYHARLQLPFMLSETNIEGPTVERWLAETWDDALSLRDEGLPIRGYCWYGFIDHVDWDSALRRNRGRVNGCGLAGLDRELHPVAITYSRLARAAGSGELEPIGSPTSLRYRREERELAA